MKSWAPSSSADHIAAMAPVADGGRSVLSWSRRRLGLGALLVPGTGVAVGIAAVAIGLAPLLPVVGSPVIAIVLGISITLVRRPPELLRPGIAFASKRVLQTSVVVLGVGLSLGQVFAAGVRSLPVLLGTLLVALAMAWLAGRALGLGASLQTLIGVGTAICGASAIAAVDAVIDAEEAEVSYAIATIFTFNVVAVLLYPALGHLIGLSQQSFGLWAGTAINDVSSVVAASTVYGHAATSYGVIVKLTRTLAIAPICLTLAALGAHRREAHSEAELVRRIAVRRMLPVFVVAFVGAVVVNTVHLVPTGWHHGLSELSTWMITAALAAIGLSTDLGQIRRAGLKPLALGAILWATVGVTSLGLQAATGTL